MADAPLDVLLVEDSEVAAAVALRALRAQGWSVLRLADGGEAARMLAEGDGAAPRVVLLDWELPGADAPAVLERMVAAGTRGASRVLLLTSHAAGRAGAAGADGHVPKPFTAEALVDAVRAALGD